MEPGNIVAYIDRQRITCAVVLEIKQQKIHLLNEQNREVSLSSNRILHISNSRMNSSAGRDEQVRILKETATREIDAIKKVNIKELWEVLHSEQEWIDAGTIADLCFPLDTDFDKIAVVIRAFFADRNYFKFDQTRFFPYSEEQVDQMIRKAEEEKRKKMLIENGVAWLKRMTGSQTATATGSDAEIVEMFKSAYIFGKEHRYYPITKKILAKSGMPHTENLFPLLVRAGAFDVNENLDLYRLEIPVDFSENTIIQSKKLLKSKNIAVDGQRHNLTHLNIMTIDGPETKDFDDAISVERQGDNVLVGIHITDVAHFIKKNDVVDQEALERGSSIYLPDLKIPMLPPELSEDLCSLKAGEIKPAISIMAKLTPLADVVDYEILASYISVKRQLTFGDVDTLADSDQDIGLLLSLAKQFRCRRFVNGAVHISLPEINLRVEGGGDICLTRVDRESPGRMLVSEIMIMANWLSAKFLATNGAPAVFRSQPEPKERLYRADEGTLFQNYMQRRHLSRFKLGDKPECHSGLGVEAYVTVTSPIRKYYDLLTQRQIRALLGMETLYTADDIHRALGLLDLPLANVGRIQFLRNRYWILKYLERKIGEQQEAIVLLKKKNCYQILLPDYMLECELPTSGGIKFKPESLIQVKIQHVDARKDLISVFLC